MVGIVKFILVGMKFVIQIGYKTRESMASTADKWLSNNSVMEVTRNFARSLNSNCKLAEILDCEKQGL